MSTAAPRTEGSRKRELLWALLVTGAVKAGVVALGLTVFLDTICVRQLVVDVQVWHGFLESARRGLIPYVHFSREYPVGTGLLYWALSPFLPDGKRGVLIHAAVMTAVDLLNTALFHRILWDLRVRRRLFFTLLFSINLTSLCLSPVRFEACVVTFVLLGYLVQLRGRPVWASLIWSLGSCVKWFPAFFIAARDVRALVIEGKRRQWASSLLILGGVSALLNAPFALADFGVHGHLEHWSYPYRFHAGRPLYWDTLLGVGQLWIGALRFEKYASLFSLGLIGTALLARPSMGLEAKGTLACLAAIALNRVYSPQFHLWFYPFLIVLLSREEGSSFRRLLAVATLLDVLNVVVYPLAYPMASTEIRFGPGAAFGHAGPWTWIFTLAVVARTIVVVHLAAWILSRPDSDSASGVVAGRAGPPSSTG